ncbi:MAG TPA: hypothetical protein VJ276_08775 [Thermoanaerobaculia bacterium]|nr:hypothetical protein [Thermoanaerobaculia bacterium]
MTRMRLFAVSVLFALTLPTLAQTQCTTRDMDVPSSFSGEITISSCKNSSQYYDVYLLHNLTAGRKLRFTLTKGTLPNLRLQLQRVQSLSIVVVKFAAEFSKSTLIMDVEIPVTQDVYTLIVSSESSFGTGTYTVSVADLDEPNMAAQIVPIVGHVAGANNSEFRSDLKLYNSSTSSITGKLVFTPRNQSMSASDPSMAFTLAPREIRFYEDVFALAQPGVNGASRLAVIPDGGPNAALVVDTSTYTAQSGGGELGQNPTVFRATDFFGGNAKVVGLLGKSTERNNLFVMTGPTDAQIRFEARSPSGTLLGATTKTYARDATYQFTPADLFGSLALPPNTAIEATIQSGTARVAISPVNNVSNQGRWTDFKPAP